MKGLLIKDFSYLFKNIKIYLVMIVFFIVLFTVTGANSVVIMGVFVFLAISISMDSFSLDDENNWNRYALTMPIERKDIVLGKYAYGLLGISVTMIFNILTTIIVEFIKGNIGGNLLSIALVYGIVDLIVASLLIVFISLLYPVMFKLGAEKARMFMMGIVIIPAIIVFIAVKLFPNGLRNIVDFLVEIGPMVTGVGYGVIILVILFIAIRASIKIMEKKEF